MNPARTPTVMAMKVALRYGGLEDTRSQSKNIRMIDCSGLRMRLSQVWSDPQVHDGETVVLDASEHYNSSDSTVHVQCPHDAR